MEFSTSSPVEFIFQQVNKSTKTNTKTQLLLYDYLIPIIGILIIILNGSVVISSGLILKKGQQPRSTYLFLGNVALTDLVTGIAVLFGQFYPKTNRNHYVCSIQIGMIVSSTLTSVYSVGLIAIDRFLYILYGLQYQRWVYPARARLMIASTWLVGVIIGFLPLMGWHGDTQNGRICWFILLAPKYLVLLTVLIGSIPLLIVIVLYSIILYQALRKIKELQTAASQRNRSEADQNELRIFKGKPLEEAPKDNKKWKAIKVVLFTSGSFVVTWSPYFLASLVYVFSCKFGSEEQKCKSLRILIASPLAILGFMNSFVNPIIYAWWHKGFRQFVKKRITVFRLNRMNEEVSKASKSTSTRNVSSTTSERT